MALNMLGAKVYGYALESIDTFSLYNILDMKSYIDSTIGDIRDFELLTRTFKKSNPEVVFHLAAQAIVRDSYKNPRETYETNVMGTVNILECLRGNNGVKSFLNVTTDKDVLSMLG